MSLNALMGSAASLASLFPIHRSQSKKLSPELQAYCTMQVGRTADWKEGGGGGARCKARNRA